MSDARDQLVALALSYDGVGVTNDRDKYLDLVADGETPANRSYMADPMTSGCGLVVRGLWKKSGITDRRVNPPYVPGKAMEWIKGIAQDRKAWIRASLTETPSPGDVVLVGGAPADGGVEHVYTITSVSSDEDGILIESIDGGQRDHVANECIAAKTRRWVVRNGSIWDVTYASTDPGANAPGGRRVQGWVDFDKLIECDLNLS